MYYNPNIHQRHSIRLKGYDYSRAGFYFVTICVQKMQCLFGNITDGKMILNNSGQIVNEEWLNTAKFRQNVKIHEYVIMPNHFHGIIEITHTPVPATPLPATPIHIPSMRPYSRTDVKNEYMSSISPKCNELGTIIRAFKSAVTKRINELYNSPQQKLWQRNYFENIIRDDDSYNQITNYIINNPANWKNDRFFAEL